jgi:cold shock CspA family protein
MEKIMVQANISRLFKDRGFGFAKDATEQLYFFHYSAIDPRVGIKFESLNEGQSVEFEREETPKGPRAKPRTLKTLET